MTSPGTNELSRNVRIPSDTTMNDVIMNMKPKAAPHCWSEETSCIHPADKATTEIEKLSNARTPPDPVISRDASKLKKQEQRSPGYVRLKLKKKKQEEGGRDPEAEWKPPEQCSDPIEEKENLSKSTICRLCEYNFPRKRADIDKLTMAIHFEIKHPKEKKGYRRLIHKWKKISPVHHISPRCRPEQRRNFWPRIPNQVQTEANAKSPRKRLKRKKESIRKWANLPDVIRINNHIKYVRMSKEEHKTKCSDLNLPCRKEIKCNEHVSLENLRKISHKLVKIITSPSGKSADWKKPKKVESRNFGYLNSAVNNPEIRDELEVISELVNRFNKIREDLEKYKEEIANKLPMAPNPPRTQAPRRPEPRRFWRFTHKRSKKPQVEHHENRRNFLKAGYNVEKFGIISLQSFHNPAIREAMSNWETNGTFQTSASTLEAINNMKIQFPRIRTWSASKILHKLSSNWLQRNQIQNKMNLERLESLKENEFKTRLENNPGNSFNSEKILDKTTIEGLVKESELDWSKAAEFTRYTSEAPPIILDNVLQSETIRTNSVKSSVRVQTCYMDKATGRWIEVRRASHPYIKVNMSKINPRTNKAETETKQLCVMADSGAMCTLLTFDTCRQLGVIPENLPSSTTTITGVGGISLTSTVRYMHARIVNPRNRAESWERVYASPDLDMSLISKDCMVRLGILDPKLFITEKEAQSFQINTVEENDEKKSICERTWTKKPDGTVVCKCPKRVKPAPFVRKYFEDAFDEVDQAVKAKGGNLSDYLMLLLRREFNSSAMNVCQTQILPMMQVPEMTVELKNEHKAMKAKRTTRVMATPLALKDQTKKDLDNAVRMGILENVSSKNNHDLWLAPMIVVPKKDNTPRRVIDFSLLNRFCKRSAEASLDTNRMATAVPVPEPGKEIFFSCLDAWNGYHSIPLAEEAKKYFGFLSEWGTFRYNVAPQGFLGSGDHYVAQYNSIMTKLLVEEEGDPNSVFKCFSDKSQGPKWSSPAWKRCIDDTLIWSTSQKQSFLQCAKYLSFCGTEGIIFNPKKLEVGKKEVNIFGFRMTQSGVLPSINQIESISKYPNPANLRDMRGFMGLVNQSTFCLSGRTRGLMEKLKDTLKSTRQWEWSDDNKKTFELLKEYIVADCNKGIKRLTSHSETPLVIISDWSKRGSGFTLYEVTCCHTENWDTKSENSDIKILCCPNEWRMIMAGGRFNSETEANYAPVEGELLGIASALHKSRYFVSGHPNVTVITDHKPILNLLQNRTRTINNKRLTNLRRKCDDFIFKTGYGRGMDNTADAISRIKGWSLEDPERLPSVDDNRDIDDDSIAAMRVRLRNCGSKQIRVAQVSAAQETDSDEVSADATEKSNMTDLADVIIEVNNINLFSKGDLTNTRSAVLGSWHTTPDPQKLEIMLNMFGDSNREPEDLKFNEEIENLDRARATMYETKLEASEDFDSTYENRHSQCNHPEHLTPAEDRINCFATNVNNRGYYSINWEEIAETALEDSFLVELKAALQADNQEKLKDLLSGKKIHDKESSNGLRAITIEDLSIYRDVVMVADRIWGPKPMARAFFNNLHLGHRAVDMMKRLAMRSVYWCGMARDLEDFFNECEQCQDMQRKNKEPEKLPQEETTRPYECITMDHFFSDAGEWCLLIVDKHTGFVWLRKTGNQKIGTAEEVEKVLDETMGPNIFSIKKFKSDEAGNLTKSVMEELCKRFGIKQDKSSAHHPAGNLHVESTVGRVKRVLGKRRVEDALREVNALNLSQPYSHRVQTPNEEMTGRPSQVSGIPTPDHILDGKIPADRITKGEYRGTNPNLPQDKPQDKSPEGTNPTDLDPDTAAENEMSKDWTEPVSDRELKNSLDCGDRVFFIDYHFQKGPRRWRTGIIIQRKKEFFYHDSKRTAHGYDIYDVENCTHVTRTRKDIRKYRPGKMERETMEQINENLAKIRHEYLKNKKFISPGEFKVPPLFELKGYDNEPPTSQIPHTADPMPEPEQTQQNPTTVENNPETPDPQSAPTEVADPPAPTEPEPPQPTESKKPKMLSRLSSALNGSKWTASDNPPNFTVEPLRSRRRFTAAQVKFWDRNYNGPHDGSPDNTEAVPDDEPETDHDVQCTTCALYNTPEENTEDPEEPQQTESTEEETPKHEEG